MSKTNLNNLVPKLALAAREYLQPVDLPLDLAVAPGQSYSRPYCRQVFAKPAREAHERL